MKLLLTDVSFVRGSASERASGLMGFVAVTVDGALRLEGLALRRTVAGNLSLSFPERRDASGERHPLVRPLGDDARIAIEAQVFAALAGEEAP